MTLEEGRVYSGAIELSKDILPGFPDYVEEVASSSMSKMPFTEKRAVEQEKDVMNVLGELRALTEKPRRIGELAHGRRVSEDLAEMNRATPLDQ